MGLAAEPLDVAVVAREVVARGAEVLRVAEGGWGIRADAEVERRGTDVGLAEGAATTEVVAISARRSSADSGCES